MRETFYVPNECIYCKQISSLDTTLSTNKSIRILQRCSPKGFIKKVGKSPPNPDLAPKA